MISCKTKENLYSLWNKNRSIKQLETEYKQYAKMLEKVIKVAKSRYESDLIRKNSNNPRNLWKYINTNVGEQLKQNNEINYICDNNQKISNPSEIAKKMSTYFREIGTNLCEKIKTPKNTSLKLPPNHLKTIFIKPTHCLEITNIINELKDKNVGVDKINSKTLKIMKSNIIIPLVHILYQCIDKSISPDTLKYTEIIPIYKNGEKITCQTTDQFP